MNEPPDEPAGLSLRKNGPAILSKSYPPAPFAPPAMFSNPGGNFRERTRVMCGRDDNVFLRHQYSLRYCNILDFLLKIVGL